MTMDGKSMMEVILETSENSSINKITKRDISALAAKDGLIVDDYTPRKIKAIRETTRMSQAVFAHALNVNPNCVMKWERGASKPAGAAIKLLSIIESKGVETILP